MTSDEVVVLETDGPVAKLRLNRPDAYNAFNTETRRRLRECIEIVDNDDAIRIVILRGEGPGFCAGADLREDLGGSVRDQLENEYRPILEGIAQSPKIWIASVHGSAAGIGGALVMNCDLVAMAEDANIYLAFAAIGLIPDGGATWLLLNAMGYRRALETVIEGRKIPASECLELGIANRLVPSEEVHGHALEWARRLAEGAPLAQAAAKRVLRECPNVEYGTAFSLEAKEQEKLTGSQDCRDAIDAFFEKRKPVFHGR